MMDMMQPVLPLLTGNPLLTGIVAVGIVMTILGAMLAALPHSPGNKRRGRAALAIALTGISMLCMFAIIQFDRRMQTSREMTTAARKPESNLVATQILIRRETDPVIYGQQTGAANGKIQVIQMKPASAQ